MSKLKFEDCFLKNKFTFLRVECLQEIHDRQDGSFEKEYYGDFYCPECFESPLSFHPNAQTPHFRSNGVHTDECSCNFPPATKRQIEEFCENKNNRDEINRKLKSCLELLKI